MKGKIPNIFGVVIALVLALSLVVAAVPAAPAVADSVALTWSAIPIPKDGATGEYALWSGSDVGPIAVSPDGGTLFAASGSTSSNYTTPMRSTDGGYSWKQVMTLLDASAATMFAWNIVDIDVSDDWADDDTVVVATANATAGAAYISIDRGQTFSSWGTFTDPVTSLDIGIDENGNLVAVVGTAPASGDGDVYLRTLVATWAAQSVATGLTGDFAVLDVGIPTYAADEGIVAVVSDADETLARTKLSTNAWAANIADTKFVDQMGVDFDSSQASIGFPDDYNLTAAAYGGNNVFFVGLTGVGVDGDVFKVTSQPVGATNVLAEDLNVCGVVGINPTETDTYSIAVTGDLADATIVAGTAAHAPTANPNQRLIHFSADAGATWSGTYKSPTGGPTGANTNVAIGSSIAYAGTSGTESAFSASTTDGYSWNQRGLIDTVITTINDIAASETYDTDQQLFMATQNSGPTSFSLWQTVNGGTTWDRILCNSPSATVAFNSVQLVPGYVFVAYEGGTLILRSHDGGTTFLSLLLAKAAITAWTVTGPTTVYTGHAGGALWWTTNFATWSKPDESEITGTVTDIELGSPDILVGDNAGKVYLSVDEGLTVEQVGTNAVTTGSGVVTHVAFDIDHDANNILYAGASSGSDVFRFNIETSTLWENISSVGGSGVLTSGLVSADDGTLYASDADAGYAVWRSVNPTYPTALGGPDFESVTTGLTGTELLEGLVVVPGSNILFAFDPTGSDQGVYIYTDTLTGRVTLMMPSDETTAGDIVEGASQARVVLVWELMTGATSYQYQVALTEDFGTLIAAASSTTAGTVQDVTLWLGTEFFWRVRVTLPLDSQWSETWSFITPLGPGAERPTLLSPTSGAGLCASDVPLRPVFQWTGLVDATNYEFQVSTNAEFTAVVSGLDKTGTSALDAQTAYSSTVSLSEGTNYFWRVRALILDSEGAVVTQSPWSDTGCFTAVAEALPADVAPTPAWVWAVIAIGAILAVGVIVLIMRTRKPV